MSENKSWAFWEVNGWVKEAARRLEMKMSHNNIFRVTNAYIAELTEQRTALHLADNTDDFITADHSDPTGERAIKNVMAWMKGATA